MKGLSDFQRQIDDCIKEQKQIESLLVALSILQASTHCKEITSEQNDIQESLDRSTQERQNLLQSLKGIEADLRKVENSSSDRQRQINSLRNDLVQMKQDSIQAQKQMDNSKLMIEQKRSILAEFEKDCANINQRRSDFEKNISQAKKDLEKISKKVNESEKLQQEGSTRDEYLKIKTDIPHLLKYIQTPVEF